MFTWVLGACLNRCKNSFPTASRINNLNEKGELKGAFGFRKHVCSGKTYHVYKGGTTFQVKW